MELLWGLYINRSTWKTVYRPFGSIGFHAAAGIPAFRVQRVKGDSGNLDGLPRHGFSDLSTNLIIHEINS